RAVDGAGAAAGRGDLRDREEPQRAREGVDPAGRAEHQRGAALRPLRLHPGERPRRARRQRRRIARERGREGILPRHRRRRPPLVPRRQALPPAQALAIAKVRLARFVIPTAVAIALLTVIGLSPWARAAEWIELPAEAGQPAVFVSVIKAPSPGRAPVALMLHGGEGLSRDFIA